MAMLEVNNLHSYYGNIHALKGISLKVEQGEIVSLIGGNGAKIVNVHVGEKMETDALIRMGGECVGHKLRPQIRSPDADDHHMVEGFAGGTG